MDLITTTEQLTEVCSRMAGHRFVTVDTEFLRETTYYPLLCVAQMATDDEAVVIDALAEGIEIVHLTGSDLTEDVWDAFFDFYMDTGSRKWGRPYLNRLFFSLIGERMADRILLIMARQGGRYIAGALNLIGSEALYGRYWGTVEDHPFLHFEVCYYQAIDWAIAHGLGRVEAGAQGEHKLARGYRPTTTHSAHFIADPGFRRAVADYLRQERRQVAGDNAVLQGYLPFRDDARREADE